jgi:3-oxoacyl-[acyl-carrier protein] reductase
MSQKTALVIGGSRGIGAAIVDELSAKGYRVAYTYNRTPAHGMEAEGIQADIRDAASVATAFERAMTLFGHGPDCVVANAGINVPGRPLADFPAEDMRVLVETNIVGAFNVLQQASRHVRDNGAIIALTTSLVRHAVPGIGPYSATKAAVEAMLRSLQKEVAGRGVRVNGIAPGPVDTDLFRSGKDEAAIQRSAAMSPFNRVGEPAEIAKVVAFIASEEASWVAGQIIQPNGGMV